MTDEDGWMDRAAPGLAMACSYIDGEIVLRPTHWLPAPADPPGFDQ
jgi:hypothetical protein